MDNLTAIREKSLKYHKEIRKDSYIQGIKDFGDYLIMKMRKHDIKDMDEDDIKYLTEKYLMKAGKRFRESR